jgi:hypothetical protein
MYEDATQDEHVATACTSHITVYLHLGDAYARQVIHNNVLWAYACTYMLVLKHGTKLSESARRVHLPTLAGTGGGARGVCRGSAPDRDNVEQIQPTLLRSIEVRHHDYHNVCHEGF